MTDPADGPNNAKSMRPGRRKRRKEQPVQAKSRFELLEDLLREPVQIVINQEPQQVAALHAIVLQLLEKSTKGNKKANRLLSKFERFARSHVQTKRVEIKFVEDDSLNSVPQLKKENDDE